MKLSIICGVAALILVGACSTHIAPPTTPNQRSIRPFKIYSQVYLLPLHTDKMEGDSGDLAAEKRIQDTLKTCMSQIFPSLSTTTPTESDVGLRIEPTILDLKKVNASERFFLGPIAGSSAVLLKVSYIDNETKQQIATSTFYSKANSWGGTMTIGATDNLMLLRASNLACEYAQSNYE